MGQADREEVLMSGTLTALALFGWGALGGMAMAAVVFVVPVVSRFALTGDLEAHHRDRAHATVLTVVLLGALAGVVALTLPDSATRGQAIFTGFGSQAILKGLVSAGKDALPLAR